MAKATRVRLLDSGTLVIDQSHITWNIGCGTPVRFPVYSVLIEHADGLFMFDSGYDLDLVNEVLPFELPEQTAEQTGPAQLAKCGFKPEDVDAVINSHLHFDHCGGNKHLVKATTYLHRDELRQARTPEPFERLGYADRCVVRRQDATRRMAADAAAERRYDLLLLDPPYRMLPELQETLCLHLPRITSPQGRVVVESASAAEAPRLPLETVVTRVHGDTRVTILRHA